MQYTSKRKLYVSCLMSLAWFLFSMSVSAQDYAPGELIIKMKNQPGLNVQGRSKAMQNFSKKIGQKGLRIRGSWSGLNLHHTKIENNKSVEEMIAELSLDEDVEFVEPNFILRKASLTEFGDVSDVDQMNVKGLGAFSQTSAPIDVDGAWSVMSPSLPATTVAVIDTGLDMDHDSFTQTCAIWTNSTEYYGTPGVDDDGNGYIDDFHGWNFVSDSNMPQDDDGHGTHVSGIVVGTGLDILDLPSNPSDNCTGAYQSNIKVMALKFLDSSGAGTTSDAIKAIYYAVNNGAKVLNNSWGGGEYSRALHEAVNYSYIRETIFVAAAGNAGSDNDNYPMYPSNYDVPNVVSVAATSSSDYKAGFSNYGRFSVHMGSPGVAIYSTIPNNLYGTMTGTSMAAPFVAGVAALLSREKTNLMNGYQIKSILSNSSDTPGTLSSYTITGKRLNARDAVVSAQSAAVWTDQPVYDLALSLQDRELASDLAATGTGCGLVKSLYKSGTKPPSGGGGSGLNGFMYLLAILIPSLVFGLLRQTDIIRRRRHDRFKVDSKVKLTAGGKEIEGSLGTISMGGASIDVDAMIDEGSVVKMKIIAPNSGEEVEVEGHIVWRSGEHAHGVKFDRVADKVKGLIREWTKHLTKVSE
ncbi:MAG: S8 family serine peptidase [Bdellovibrionales bacterium]